jgi:Integrase core domain
LWHIIRDRAWRTQTRLELAIVAYIGWHNHDRLHEALGDLPPAEYEALRSRGGRRTPRSRAEPQAVRRTSEYGMRRIGSRRASRRPVGIRAVVAQVVAAGRGRHPESSSGWLDSLHGRDPVDAAVK